MRTGRILGIAAVAVLVAGAVLYWGVGVRLILDGSARPQLGVVPSPEATARAVEAHRAAQRMETPALPPGSAQPPAALSPGSPGPRDAATSERPHVDADSVAGEDASPPAAHGGDGSSTPAVYWTGFRGPSRDGHYREQPILTDWPSSGLQPLWRQPIGGGYASFSIAGGLAFTIEQRRDREVVAAYDVDTGRELWAHEWAGEFREWMGGDGPRATPTWSDGHVYALGALGELRVLDDRTGELVWRVNILEDNGASNLPWGMAASPLVTGDLVVVLPGGRNGRSVVAYDKHTGARVWSSLSDQATYAAPMLVMLAGRPQILVHTATRLVGLTPESGELLWEYPWARPTRLPRHSPCFSASAAS